MKKFCLVSFLLLIACKPIKFRQLESDQTQEMKGKVREIAITEYNYKAYKKDTVPTTSKIFIFYNKNKKITRITQVYPDYSSEKFLYYENNLLVTEEWKLKGRTIRRKNKYDNRNNNIETYSYKNDTLESITTLSYDRRNNLVSETTISKKNKRKNEIDKFIIDYEKRIITHSPTNDENIFTKIHYNKKGYIIKTETIYPEANSILSSISSSEYDSSGNIIRKTISDKDNVVKSIWEYKNKYDKKGNIIVREKFLNGKLFIKSDYKITYW